MQKLSSGQWKKLESFIGNLLPQTNLMCLIQSEKDSFNNEESMKPATCDILSQAFYFIQSKKHSKLLIIWDLTNRTIIPKVTIYSWDKHMNEKAPRSA